MKLNTKKIAVIGVGVMGSLISKALESRGYQVIGLDKGSDIKKAESCDVVVLAVKPQDYKTINLKLANDQLVISIMAGVSVSSIKKHFKTNKVVRAMPNTPGRVGRGFTGYFVTKQATEEDKNFAKELFDALGESTEVSTEDSINKITAVSGSGPAYVFYMLQNFIDSAKSLGIKEKDAKKMVLQTLRGSLAMLEENTDINLLIKNVTSKGGTTEAALKVFDKKNISKTWQQAVESAYKRAKELSK